MRESVTAAARALGLLVLLAMAGPAVAQLSVADARIRHLPGDLPLAGYFELGNDGDEARVLTGAASEAFGRVMLHRSVIEDDQNRMEPVGQLVLGPGNALSFAPGGLHLMLMERRRALAPGDTVTVELRFEDGERLSVDFKVVSADAQ